MDCRFEKYLGHGSNLNHKYHDRVRPENQDITSRRIKKRNENQKLCNKLERKGVKFSLDSYRIFSFPTILQFITAFLNHCVIILNQGAS